tara:strand:+ start:64 stop:1323 length:1260 start_codon:yes stop_codon:yes gene_type:complete
MASSISSFYSGKDSPVLIVGAGMAGLGCAVTLHQAGVPVLVFEGDDEVGGRVRTDEIEGYRLDRGFQVLLTAYPEARKFLDYEKLELRTCYPGSMVWFGGHFHRVADPFRRPIEGVKSIFNPIGSLIEKLRVGMMRMGFLSTGSFPDDCSTSDALIKLGFGPKMIDRFWKPFMRGVFLENELSTSVRKFEETFRLFGSGDTALPRHGIGEIPKQLAGRLPLESIHFGKQINKIEKNGVESSEGEKWVGRAVVLATEFNRANQLLASHQDETSWNSVDCLYFSLPLGDLPTKEPILHLDGSGKGPINNLNFISTTCDCAPPEKALVSLSVLGKQNMKMEKISELVREQLGEWFGPKSKSWKFVRGYRIPHAVPRCIVPIKREPVVNGIYRCGDYQGLPSIDTALRSGRETAELILKARTG